MGLKDFDINIAIIKRDIKLITKDEPDKTDVEFYEMQMKYMKDKISTFTFKKTFFCDGLFAMLMPSELFGEPIVVENILFFQSSKEKMTLVVKVIDSEQIINFEKIQADYINQMRQSKQQTKIDVSASKQVETGSVYYFSAVHHMPGGGLYNFIILFQVKKKMVFIDFNLNQKDYFFWKPILCSLSSTIQMGGETDR